MVSHFLFESRQHIIHRGYLLTMITVFGRYGLGKATFSNGDTYEGMYVNDKREGPGVYKWRDGRVYDGEFKE